MYIFEHFLVFFKTIVCWYRYIHPTIVCRYRYIHISNRPTSFWLFTSHDLIGAIPSSFFTLDHFPLAIFVFFLRRMLYGSLIGALFAVMYASCSSFTIYLVTFGCFPQRMLLILFIIKTLFEDSLYHGFLRYSLAMCRLSVV